MQPPPHMPPPPMPKKNAFKKGLGFVPNSISRYTVDPIKEMLDTTLQPTKDLEETLANKISNTPSGSSIPIFDLEHASKTSGQERSRLIQALGIGLSRVGFIAVKAEALTPLIDAAHKEMRRYFHLPFEHKIQDWKSNDLREGYAPRKQKGTFSTSTSEIKETFYIPPEFKGWPRGFTSFMRVMSQYHASLSEYSRYLTQSIMTYLGQHDEQWSGPTDNLLELVYHPMLKHDDTSHGFWTAPHYNPGLITLSSPGTVPGLQFLSNHNQWQPVTVPEGFLILNSGLQLEHKTAGLIKARQHRIINPGGPYTRLERFATVYSAYWPGNYSLKPFENCISLMTKKMSRKEKGVHLEDYGNITVAELKVNPS